jgi:hypothetical protein
MTASDEDGYTGPAELIANGTTVAVEVKLAGHFEPISGKYRWYGRVGASDEVRALLSGGVRQAVLRTPHGEVATTLGDVDPWGRPRVEGFGAAPFEVATSVGG